MPGYFARHTEPGYWGDITRHFDPSAPLLDLGCGTGWLGEHFADYTGMELSTEAVTEARGLGRNVIQGDAGAELPFPPASFSQVICKDVLEHVADPIATTAELRRVTAPGGRVYACTPDSQHWVWEDYSHRRPFPLRALRHLFTDAGFTVQRSGYETVFPGVGILSGWTKDHRRPPAVRPISRLPFVRRNTWVLVQR